MENSELLDAVKKWISNNSKIKELQSELKILKLENKNYTRNLANIMNKGNIEGLNLNNDSKIICKKQKTLGGITKKILTSSLSEFIKDKSELDEIINHILSKRTEKIDDKIQLKS